MGAMMIRGNAAENPGSLPPVRGFQEVGKAQVELSGGFWGPRVKTTHDVTIPHALDELEKDGHVTNFDKAAGKAEGPLKGHHAFDSDLYKTLEGALNSLEQFNDPALKKRVDGIIDRILAAQQKELLELREGQKRAQRDLDAVKRRLAVSERNVSSVSSALAAVLAQSVES